MTRLHPVVLICAIALGGCAHYSSDGEARPAGPMKSTSERYLACIAAEAEKDMKNPAGAEDIAVAAHARCWAAWDDHRKAAGETFLGSARTEQERQLARDRTDAHLRQFERDARRTVMDAVVHRNLHGAQRAP